MASYDAQTKRLVTVVHNADRVQRSIDLTIAAPAGNSLAGTGYHGQAYHDDTGVVEYKEEAASFAAGAQIAHTLSMQPGDTRVFAYDLTEAFKPGVKLHRQQIFAGDPKRDNAGILFQVAPDERVSLPIQFPANMDNVRTATLRLVLERATPGEAFVTIGNTTLPIPGRWTAINDPAIIDLPVDPAILKGVDAIEIHAGAADVSNGFLLGMASVLLDTTK